MGLGLVNLDVGSAFKMISNVIDKIFPDKNEAARIKNELVQYQQQGNLEELKAIVAPFLAEAQSHDKWTSRARPSFLYVMYLFILCGIPMGVLSFFNPAAAKAVAEGMGAWMSAIPTSLWGVFGACFSVYTIARTYDKKKQIEA